MTWDDAVRQSGPDVLIDVEVVPGSSRDEFPAGVNSWRKRVQARVRAPATGGKANAALVGLIARVLDVEPARVSIEAGAKGRLKQVRIRQARAEDIQTLLRSMQPPDL